MGAGGSPCGVARAGGFAVGPALATPQGLPTAPNMGGAEGELSASYLSVGFLLSDSSYRLPPPLGVGGGLAGAMAAPSAIAPALEFPSRAGAVAGL